MPNQLSFEPRYHRQIELEGNQTAWTLIISPFSDPMRFVKEIVEEQKQIEREGGSILVIDPKH